MSRSAFGNGPAAILKESYSPGLIAVSGLTALHSIVPTAWLIVPPCPSGNGAGKVVLLTLYVHPGWGCTDTEAIGVSVGSATEILTVAALSLSVGTRNSSSECPPWTASLERTVTWAEATQPEPNSTARPTTTTAPSRASTRFISGNRPF